MAHFSAHCKTFIFPSFFSCTLRYETTSCRGNKMEWNKLENRVTPVLFYSVVNCTLITILVCHDAFPLYFRKWMDMDLFSCSCVSVCRVSVHMSIHLWCSRCLFHFIHRHFQFKNQCAPTHIMSHAETTKDRNHGWNVPSNAYYKFNVNQMNWSGE